MKNRFKKSGYTTTKRLEKITVQYRWAQHRTLRPFDWLIFGIERRNVMKEHSGVCERQHYVYRISFFGIYVNVWKTKTRTPKARW